MNSRTQFETSEQLTQTILAHLSTDKGIHPETAISAAALMAGTLLLRSCRLPLANLTPGSPVFSDRVNRLGPRVLETVHQTLTLLEIPIDVKSLSHDIAEANRPLLTLQQVQNLLDAPISALLQNHGLSDKEGYRAAAISVAVLIDKAKAVLNPSLAFAIVVDGLRAGSSTVPFHAA